MAPSSLYCNATSQYSQHPHREIIMAATKRSIRLHFATAMSAVRSFSIELYAAHGGWAPVVRG